MKRLHVHISVENIDTAVAFYSALFDQKPNVSEHDYAKWEVDDPRVNFAVSTREGMAAGVNHLGIQAENEIELAELHGRLSKADIASKPEPDAHCCYAHGNKHWAADPSAVVWEMFHTMSGATTYGEDNSELEDLVVTPRPAAQSSRCC